MTYEEVKRQLEGVTYSKAIEHYNQMKQQFIEQYEQGLKKNVKSHASEYISHFIDEINNGKFQGKSFGAANVLIEQLQASFIDSFENANLSSLDDLIKTSERQYSNLTEKGKKELKNFLDQNFKQENIDLAVKKALQSLKIRNDQKGLNTSDLLVWSRSYIQQLLYAKAAGINANPNKAVLAGYFEEALFHKSTAQLTKHLKNKASGAIQVGSIKLKNEINSKNVDTIFDEYFNFFSQNLNKDFETSVNVDENTLLKGFGVQVKLKNLPWLISNPKGKYFPIGQNTSLFSAFVDKSSWIKGVKYLENYTLKAMGDNVMYMAGNKLVWTAELISDARASDYYLAFFYNPTKNELTSTIRWEPIDMSKPE